MAHLRHFAAMLWKNWLLKKRNPLSSACELLLPLGFVLIMVGLYSQFETVILPDTSYVDSALAPLPVGPLAGRLALSNQVLALVAADASTVQTRDDFMTHLTATYPAFNGATVGGGVGFTSPLLRSLTVPSLASQVRVFDTEAQLQDYVKHPDYKKEGYGPAIWAAITFNHPFPRLVYAIRANVSDVFNTRAQPVSLLQRGVDLDTTRKYTRVEPLPPGGNIFARPQNINPVLLQPFPGFMTLQLMVDRWAINKPAPLNTLDPTVMLQTVFAPSLSYVLPTAAAAAAVLNETRTGTLNTTVVGTATTAAVVGDILNFLKGEALAPQQVSLVPFPVSGYRRNNFYGTVLPLFAFFFVIVVLFPISRLIRGIVMEKEAKIREGMRMMGLTDASWYFSWLVLYSIYFAVLALLITIVTKPNIFSASNAGTIWGYFFLFGLSCTSYAQLISVFFSKAKTASTVGVVLYLGGYFPFFAVQPAEISYGAKTAASLLAPTAFGLGIELIGTFEADGTGASRDTAQAFVNNWALQQSVGMLLLDTILYAVLAWYIDAVMPASFREFGVPRPWYFPFTASYWREVLNLGPVKRNSPTSPLLASGPADSASSSSSSAPWYARLLGLAPAGNSAGGAGTRVHNGPAPDPSFIEEPDTELRAKEREGRAVLIHKLRKEFATPDGTKVAVDDIDMTMYEGQIFVLLGHNGAGKTTTISMLTGLIEPSDGGMNVFGRDVNTNLADIRKDLGVCPQHDVLWPELTVEEHLQIFCAIKGVPRDRVKGEIAKALQEVGLTEKLRYKSGALSGGQKRKLSVCIALCGGSRFILLDEPTSGMDPYSRRSTWQILQNAREGRVLLLTTHFMDEADILGDRITIMANGQVKCCGSPMFLKRKYGVGYVLTLVKEAGADSGAITAAVRSFVPEVEVGSDVGAELSLRLPLESSSTFPAMLASIDSNAASLGVAQYGVSVSDIQDVFMKVAHGEGMDAKLKTGAGAEGQHGAEGEHGTTTGSTAGNAMRAETVPVPPVAAAPAAVDAAVASTVKVKEGADGPGVSDIDRVRAEGRAIQTGFATFARHFGALFTKRMQSARRDAKALCYQILIPVIMTAGGLALLKASQFGDFPDLQMSTAVLNAARGRAEPRYPNYITYTAFKSAPLGAGRVDSAGATSLITDIPYPNVTTDEGRLILGTADMSRIAADDPYGFVTSTRYPTRDWQALSSFLLGDKASYPASKYGAYVVGGDIPGVSKVTGQPATATLPTTPALSYAVFHNTSWRHGAPTLVNLMNSAAYRAASGDPTASITVRSHPLPFTLRQSNLISAFFTFSAAIIIVMAFAFFPASVAIFVTKEREVSAKHQQLISGVSIPAYWLSNYAFDLLSYVVPSALSIALTRAFEIKEFIDVDKDRAGAFVLLFALYGTSVTPFTYVISYLFKSHSTAQNVSLIIGIVAMILMIASLIMSQVESTCRYDQRLRFVWRLLPGFSLGNGLISLSFLNQLPLIDSTCDLYAGIIRPASAYAPYNAFDNSATGYNLAYMGMLSPVYLLLAIAIDMALAHPRLRLLLTGNKEANVADIPEQEDDDVAAERTRVAQQAASGTCTDVVQLRSLRKVYAGGKVAVKNLSYGMPTGQVFGFLGINGAGKTTTLQMLSGDVLPTAGTATLGGYDIIRQQADVRRLLGYCPQWDALLENMTTREHLELYARIKGVPEKEVAATVEASLAALDLTSFANKLAQRLSGGNKRKLSVAIALIGSPPLVFLDEPSTGMDPVAKRFMWRVISRVATESKQCSIILTTHSMEEVEALCTRIGIMVGGRLRCLGSSQHLKNRHGQGFVSEIRLGPPGVDEVDGVEARMAAVLGTAPGPFMLARRDVVRLAEGLGAPARAAEVSDMGTGWAIQAAFAASTSPSPSAQVEERAIPGRLFAEWWAEEEGVARLLHYMTSVAFPGAECVEKQGLALRFRLPASKDRLSDMFARLEAARAPPAQGGCGVASYTLGQTTLEQIFVQFASQQEEETNVARGMVVRAPPAVAPAPAPINATAVPVA